MNSEELSEILEKTGGRCHLCKQGRLGVKSYGTKWELDHSNPKARGGTDRRSNLLPAHVSCNRAKRDRSTRSVRNENGFSRRPLSKAERAEAKARNVVLGAASGIGIGALLAGGPAALVLGGVGLLVGNSLDVE